MAAGTDPEPSVTKPANAVASPRLKQGRISGYFTSRRTPLRTGKAFDDTKTAQNPSGLGGLVAAELETPSPMPVRKRKVPVVSVPVPATPVPASPVAIAVAAPAAYERLAPLVTAGTRMGLPEKLQLLQRIHSALESVCQLTLDRDQPAIFHRVKKAAENIVGREITLEHLKQMYALVPEAYVFRPVQTVHLGRRTPSFAISFPEAEKGTSHATSVDRRDAFHSALLAHVRLAHDAFLKSIDVRLPADAKLRSWHPKFDLENTPDVSPKELVDVPKNEAGPVAICPSTPSQIVEVILETTSATRPPKEAVKGESHVSGEISTLSIGKKLSLLERIKAKERQAEAQQMLAGSSDTVAASELAVLSEFAENLAFLFASACKGALPLGDVTSRLTLGSKVPLSGKDIATRLHRLSALLPAWLQMAPTGQAVIVKLDRALGMKAVQAQLRAELQK